MAKAFPKTVYVTHHKDERDYYVASVDIPEAVDSVEEDPRVGIYELKEMRVASIVKTLVSVLLVLVLAGCSGGKKYQSWPMESEINGTVYHYHNAVQLDLPVDLFHGVNSWSHTEVCKTRLENPVTQDEHLYPFHDCKMTSIPTQVPLASVAQQMVTPVATSATTAAGFVGMGDFIGDGLKQSGTTVNQTGSAEASNQVNSGNKTTNIKPSTNINSNNVIKTK